jgi:diguanylate cyclase (GGDEF)-like protein
MAELSEQRYRAHYLAADIAQCRVALLVLIAPLAPFLWIDFRQFGSSTQFYQLAAARLLFAAGTVGLWLHLPRVVEALRLDRLLSLWAFSGALMVLYTEYVKPLDFFGHYAVDVWIIVTFFAALPLPTRTKMAPVLFFAGGGLSMLLLHKAPPSVLDTVYALLGLVLAVASGAVVSMRLHRYRRAALCARLEAEHRANTDALTGLANRRAFMQAAAIECERHERRGEPLAVILMDLDHFKQINDTHGHEAGDAVLAECAQRMTKVMRGYDLCARIGGEEFCIVMPGTPLATAVATAERIRQTLRLAPVHHGTGTIQMRASFGVAQWLLGDAGIERALARADLALYQAKRAGRDRVVVNEVPFQRGALKRA